MGLVDYIASSFLSKANKNLIMTHISWWQISLKFLQTFQRIIKPKSLGLQKLSKVLQRNPASQNSGVYVSSQTPLTSADKLQLKTK